MRTAASFMSRPSLGMSEPPIPGRSGAMTVKFGARRGISGRHMRGLWAWPRGGPSPGPSPAVRYCSFTPSTSAVRTAIDPATPASCCMARGDGVCDASAINNTQQPRRERLNIEFSLGLDEGQYVALTFVHSRGWKTRAEPAFDVVHDRLLPNVVEQIVKVAVVELQGLVRRAGGIKEDLAAARFSRPVARAVQNQHRQRDP